MRRRRNSSGGKPASSAQTRSWATRSSDRGMVIDVIAGTTRERSRMPRTTPFYRRRDWLGIARRTRLSGQARTARHFLALGFLCRTIPIKGSRPFWQAITHDDAREAFASGGYATIVESGFVVSGLVVADRSRTRNQIIDAGAIAHTRTVGQVDAGQFIAARAAGDPRAIAR